MKPYTRDAQRSLRLPFYPCDGVKAPKVNRYNDEDPNCLTADELHAVYEEIRRASKRWFPLFATVAFTGMRFCEVAGPRWGDVNLTTGAVRIRRAVYRGEVGEPKTDAGRRLVVLPSDVIELLKPLAGPVEDWVFPANNGKVLSTGVLNKPLREALKKVGITKRVTTHGIRRTFNTLAMEQASGELVRKVLGHSDASMTIHDLAPDIAQRRKLESGVFDRVQKVEGEWEAGDPAASKLSDTDEKPSTSN